MVGFRPEDEVVGEEEGEEVTGLLVVLDLGQAPVPVEEEDERSVVVVVVVVMVEGDGAEAQEAVVAAVVAGVE